VKSAVGTGGIQETVPGAAAGARFGARGDGDHLVAPYAIHEKTAVILRHRDDAVPPLAGERSLGAM
jgi:hypothetical protein